MSFKNFFKKINLSKGFTLTELLVVTSIILILTVVVLASYKFFQSGIFLQQSTNRLIQDIRRMEGMAIAAQECSSCDPKNYKYSYGVYFNSSSQDSYILFADCNNNKNYDGNDDIIEKVKLDKDIIISSLSANSLSIVFSPPDPEVDINPSSDEAEITLSDNKGRSKKVIINKAGLIAIGAE